MRDDEITGWDALTLSGKIHQFAVSCVRVMAAYLERIDRLNPAINAIVALRPPAELLAEAARCDAELAEGSSRGWMHGFPHAVKDIPEVSGLPWTLGSPVFAQRIGQQDDPVVARIRAAGAIFIGRTNTPEFGFGSHTYNPVWGVTRNAYDHTRTAGGSSGGAAAAVATRLVPVADGSDLMGSLRNPAAFNNVLGFRPSQGLIEPGEHPNTLATYGTIGRSVEDLAALLSTMSGSEILLTRVPEERVIRVGWVGDLGARLAIEPEILQVSEIALQRLRDGGWKVEALTFDFDLERLWQAFLALRAWFSNDLNELLNPATVDLIKPEARWEIERGAALTETELVNAVATLAEWRAYAASLYSTFDLVVAPTAQVLPFDADIHWPSAINGVPIDTYHRWMETVVPFTMAGGPVLNVPAGFSAGGLPIGLQLAGKVGQDAAVLSIGREYLRASPWLEERPYKPSF